MKLIIAGGRDFTNYALMWETIYALYGDDTISHVVCGMARGADLLGKRWAEEHGVAVIECWPQKHLYGVYAAFKIRNREMAHTGDQLLAFWNGVSTGTYDMITYMNSLHKPVTICMYPTTDVVVDVPPPEPDLFSLE